MQAFGADAVTIRIMLKTEPSEQWATARLMRKRIKDAFDEAGIEIPFPQRTVWVRSGEADRESGERSVRPFELMPSPLEGEGADADSADVDH
ncbi:MAG: mechanosensitive ion channel family protein [Acidimicrobiales bacterium]|nr:mechanosensitive ion channel family protein [Acidimicrobiales bacterium]